MNADPATSNPPTAAAEAPTVWQRVRRLPPQQLLLVALVPVLVALWLPLLSGAPSRPATPPVDAAVAAAMPAAPAGEMAAAPAPPGSAAAVARFADELARLTADYAPRWDPHALQLASSPAAGALRGGEPAADPRLVPSTILLSRGQAALAIVEGRTCRVGDQVAGHHIVEIAEHRVVYRDGDHTVTVRIPMPSPGACR